MKKKVLAVILGAAMTATILVGCGSGGSSDSDDSTANSDVQEDSSQQENDEQASSGGHKFGYTYWAASDFFSTIGDTLTELAEANGDEVVIVDAQQDQATQISIIEDFITQGVDGVFLNPVDREGIEPALDLLNEAGIPIVNIDTAVANLDKVNSYVASDNYGAGVQCAEKLIELIPDGGEVAILDYPANSACIDRVTGFTETIEGKGFTIVAQQDAEGKPDPGLEKTQDILQANPDIVAVFACNDQCGQGAYAAINEAGSDAIVLGVDGSPEGKEYIAEGGNFVATAAQSPKKMASESIDVIYAILAGESYETEIAVPTFIIDASNVADYMDGWQ